MHFINKNIPTKGDEMSRQRKIEIKKKSKIARNARNQSSLQVFKVCTVYSATD